MITHPQRAELGVGHRPDPLRGDVGRLLRHLVVGPAASRADARGRPPAGAAEHRRPAADGARAGGLVRARRPDGLALARGAGAARRRARAARRPRGGRLLRDAELPARRRHREGALPAPGGPVLGALVRVRRRRARRAEPPRRRRRSRDPRPLPARLARLRRPTPSSRERWRFLRAGLAAVGVLVVAALVGWAVQTARYEDPASASSNGASSRRRARRSQTPATRSLAAPSWARSTP